VASYKTQAFILKRINFGEADRLITLFSKHQGKLRVLAKGVRKPTSRKSGHLELFNLVKLVLAKGKNLDIITEVELVNSFRGWRTNLTRVGVAYYLVELIERLTPEGEKNRQLFRLLEEAFTKLKDDSLIGLIRDFERKLLLESGFGIPKRLENAPGSLVVYLEEIAEKKIKSRQVLKRIKDGR
jgi:DNA repair protein RecO (recombination protein O)